MMDHYCIRCGEPFQPASPEVVVCPACSAPPKKIPGPAIDLTPVVRSPLSAGSVTKGKSVDWHVGETILDAYEVKQIFTSGGMGLVYRVHHNSWGIDLIMKSPRPEIFTHPGGAQSFVREAETWVNLDLHPHIVACYYVRTIDNLPRLFAEFVEGGSLKDWIEDQRLYAGGRAKALERILDIAIQFAWGLAYAHEKGLVHQDVKPANVLMTSGGVAKVGDFGLARARVEAGERVDRAAGGSLLVSSGGYTPAYCSPEQARREKLSGKTDIWSWAVSIMEMFTGEITWFNGTAAREALEEYLESNSPEPYLPVIPQTLASLLRQCLQKAPEQRPQGMLEIAGRLQAIYLQEIGQSYPRQLPKATELRADSMNNKALSWVDLGKGDLAEETWQAALKTDPQHLESTYNYGLVKWRTARVTDDGLIRTLQDLETSHQSDQLLKYLQGLVYLETHDSTSALKLFEGIEVPEKLSPDVQSIISQAQGQLFKTIQLVNSFIGHNRPIKSIQLSKDGQRLITAGSDKTVRHWDVISGKCVNVVQCDWGGTDPLFLGSDGKLVLSGSFLDKNLYLWEAASGRRLRSFEGHTKGIIAVCLSADGRCALSSGHDKSVRLWDVASGKCIRLFEGIDGEIKALCLSVDGRFALLGGVRKSVYFCETDLGKIQQIFTGHTDIITAVALSADNRLAISAGWDKVIRLWDTNSGECIRNFEGHSLMVTGVSLSANGALALSGSFDKKVRLWEIASGRCLRTIVCHENSIETVFLSADGRYAISGDGDGHAFVWKVAPENLGKGRAPFILAHVRSGQAATESEAVYRQLKNQFQLAIANGDFGSAANIILHARSISGFERDKDLCQAWFGLYTVLPQVKLATVWEVTSFQDSPRGVASTCVSRDSRLALSSSKSTMYLWEIPGGKLLRTFDGHTQNIFSVALSADSQLALSGSDDKSMRLWDVASGGCLRTFDGHSNRVYSVCFSPDDRLAVSGGWDRTVRIWDIETGTCLQVLEGHTFFVESVSISADGKSILSGGDVTLRLWDVASGKSMLVLRTDDSVHCAAISRCGKFAFSGGTQKLMMWDLESGKCLRTMVGYKDGANKVALSADGRYGFSTNNLGKMYCWDVLTGERVHYFDEKNDKLLDFSLSENAGYILSGGSSLKLWFLDWQLDSGGLAVRA
jgi:WD40 repeat protein